MGGKEGNLLIQFGGGKKGRETPARGQKAETKPAPYATAADHGGGKGEGRVEAYSSRGKGGRDKGGELGFTLLNVRRGGRNFVRK